jgi:CxxC motif-containing protein (DUF1111 family)
MGENGHPRWRRRLALAPVWFGAALAIAACSSGSSSTESAPEPLVARLGGKTTVFSEDDRAFQASLRNMSIEDAARFGLSDDVFEKDFTAEEGLDPDAPATGCTTCHVNNGRGDPTGVIIFEEVDVDGVELRAPVEIVGESTADVRVAPAMIGMGLLETIPAADIEALADPDDADGDGVSGRVHYVVDPATGETVVGRFGWQASQATVLSQSSLAFETDLGILTPLLSGDDAEIDEKTVKLASFYNEGLAVTARRNAADPANIDGAALFEDIGCASCHAPTFTTGEGTIASLSRQEIWPYTDLLLHDMGPDMAGEVTFGDASAAEFRTAPLWGLGLHEVVNGTTTLLHDGRARSIEEAILWHGGEGEASRDRYRELSADERREVLTFLENL